MQSEFKRDQEKSEKKPKLMIEKNPSLCNFTKVKLAKFVESSLCSFSKFGNQADLDDYRNYQPKLPANCAVLLEVKSSLLVYY